MYEEVEIRRLLGLCCCSWHACVMSFLTHQRGHAIVLAAVVLGSCRQPGSRFPGYMKPAMMTEAAVL